MADTLSLNEIAYIVKPIADKYRIKEIYLFCKALHKTLNDLFWTEDQSQS